MAKAWKTPQKPPKTPQSMSEQQETPQFEVDNFYSADGTPNPNYRKVSVFIKSLQPAGLTKENEILCDTLNISANLYNQLYFNKYLNHKKDIKC